MTQAGCEIEDIASDVGINIAVKRYIQAKTLFRCTEDPLVQKAVFEELGLYDDLDTLMECEVVWSRYIEMQRKKNAG